MDIGLIDINQILNPKALGWSNVSIVETIALQAMQTGQIGEETVNAAMATWLSCISTNHIDVLFRDIFYSLSFLYKSNS